MKIFGVEIRGDAKGKRILIDSGSGPLEARISNVLPGCRILGVFFYPALQEISIHFVRESQ